MVASRKLSAALAPNDISREPSPVCCSRHPVLSFSFSRKVPLATMDDRLSEEEEVVAILASVSALTASTVARQQRKKRRWWVRPSLRSREVAGHAGRLLPELRARDVEYYRE